MAAVEQALPSERPGNHNGNNQTDDTIFDWVLRETQYLYALTLLLTFIIGAAWYSVYNTKKDEVVKQSTAKGPGGKPLPITKLKKRDNGERKLGPVFGLAAKNTFRILAACVVLTYVLSWTSMFIHAFRYEDPYRWAHQGLPWASEASLIHVTGATFFYLYIVISLFDWRKGPNIVHLTVWTLGFAGELTLLISTYIVAAECHFISSDFLASGAKDGSCVDRWTRIDLVLYFLRLLLTLGMMALFCAAWINKARRTQDRMGQTARTEQSVSGETVPLLNGNTASYNTQNGQDATQRRARARTFSTTSRAGKQKPQGEPPAAFYRPEKLPHKTWWEYARGYTLFFPYLWPKDSPSLQLQVGICFVLVIIQRVVNVLVPWQMKQVVDKLEAATKDVENGGLGMNNFPVKDFILLGGLWILQGQSGLLGALRSLLWIPISQYSYRGLTAAAFNHVHSLSLDFHLSKRTGEVLSALNKGSSINSFLEQVTFNVVPMLLDLMLAISALYWQYGTIYAEINAIDTCWYLYMTIKMASTRADRRREMTNADREEEAIKNDSISSYETVKYFNAEDFESQRYQKQVGIFQKAEREVYSGLQKMNICQTIVFNLGRIIAAIVCAWQVMVGVKKIGDWIAVVSYFTQLQGPLNFFGNFYRTVQQAMISGERLLELFKIAPTVVDTDHAKPLGDDFEGGIKWNNVSFAYDQRKPALKNISFECKPGTTTAFVGESGGGKSTLFRHMFRYYDCDEGTIELDGKNVKDLTIDSVRQHIGVVPQDTALFNDTIMYNLKYAKQGATDQDVFDACKAASIHHRIESFPDKYNSQVGERGLRLSGGEKQRVAIARTLLKNPKIIMLDEATSALDSNTEDEIQQNVLKLGQGRTLLIIAHRLSTITHADQIIVLNAGEIVEKGTHDELLTKRGAYAQMWEKQIRAEKARNAAVKAKLKAEKLSKAANLKKPEQSSESEDEHSDMSPTTDCAKSDGNSERVKTDHSDSSSSSGHETSHPSSDTESNKQLPIDRSAPRPQE